MPKPTKVPYGDGTTGGFTDDEHAIVTGMVAMALSMRNADIGWQAEVNVNEHGDFTPHVDLFVGGRRYRVIVADVTDA